MNNLWRYLLILLSLTCTLAWADPPGRVARLSWLDGHASVRNGVDGQRIDALRNWPLSTGSILNTERFARVEIRLGSSTIHLDEESELEFLLLDDRHLRLRLNYGNVSVNMGNYLSPQEFQLDLPQGQVVWQEAGRFRVKLGQRPSSMQLHVFDGEARWLGANVQMLVRAGHSVELYQDDVNTQLAQTTDFDRWATSRGSLGTNGDTLRYVSRDVTGFEDLDQHGTWRESSHGPAWYPHSTNFMPYRQGQWTWLSPWGWTWVDHTPWAWVTSHYGRWAWVDKRWAWLPGQAEGRRTWVPATVGWVRDGDTITHAPHTGGKLGWFPLGPNEVLVPWFPASHHYVHAANRHHLPRDFHGNLRPPGHYLYRDRTVHGHHNQFLHAAPAKPAQPVYSVQGTRTAPVILVPQAPATTPSAPNPPAPPPTAIRTAPPVFSAPTAPAAPVVINSPPPATPAAPATPAFPAPVIPAPVVSRPTVVPPPPPPVQVRPAPVTGPAPVAAPAAPQPVRQAPVQAQPAPAIPAAPNAAAVAEARAKAAKARREEEAAERKSGPRNPAVPQADR